MTDKEKIRAEVEMRLSHHLAFCGKFKGFKSMADEDKAILSFIDSLPEELAKFKIGDTIRPKGSKAEYTITSISGGCYHGKGWGLQIDAEKDYELVESAEDVDAQINSQNDAIKNLNSALNSMEHNGHLPVIEEPVSERFAFKAIPRLLEMIEPTDRAKAYIAKLADALAVEGYLTDAKIVRESLKIMNGEKVAMATMDEKPVSEDLEKAIDTYLATYFGGEKEKQDWPFLKKMAIHFANWQKKQDQSTIELAEDHAMLAGMEKMKEKMMAKAVDIEVKVDAGGYPYIDKTIELYDYDKDVPLAKEGDKYKVVLIKEC